VARHAAIAGLVRHRRPKGNLLIDNLAGPEFVVKGAKVSFHLDCTSFSNLIYVFRVEQYRVRVEQNPMLDRTRTESSHLKTFARLEVFEFESRNDLCSIELENFEFRTGKPCSMFDSIAISAGTSSENGRSWDAGVQSLRKL